MITFAGFALYENKVRLDDLDKINKNTEYNETKAYTKAHQEAIAKAENLVNGSVRGKYPLPTTKVSVNDKGGYTGNVDESYTKNGIKYTVSMTYVSGDITSVNIKPAPKNK